MLSRGQLVPAIGRRVAPGWVLLYAGQRRLLAAKRTHDLAGTNGFESINRVACLIVLMLDYEPTEADIRRVRSEISGSRPDVRAADQEQAEDHSRESTLRPPDLDDWQVMPGYAGDPMDFDGPLSLDVTLRGGAAEHKDVDNTARDIVRAFNHVFGHTNAEVAAYRVCRQSLGPPRVHARVMPAARGSRPLVPYLFPVASR